MKNREKEKEKGFIRDDRKKPGIRKKVACIVGIALIAVLGILDREEEWRKW